jgi:site-specific DNA-methyltransferase (adenine-specific)
MMLKANNYYIGDNLKLLKQVEDKSVDLCYIDPPFATNRDFGDFKDLWADPKVFCEDFIRPRVELIKTKLKPTSNLVLHCDVSASHYLKVLLDEIFGIKKFKNEIIWVTGGNAKTTKKFYKTHDSLLVYGMSAKSKFTAQYTPYGKDYFIKNNVKMSEKHHGRAYVTCAIHSSQPNVSPRPNLRYEWKGQFKQWLISRKEMERRENENRLQYSSSSGTPRIMRFLDEMSGVPIKDVWTDINSIQAGEKENYATQKPVKLLERILLVYSDVNDLVLDCFAGSGTTGRACLNLDRAYLLLDKNVKGQAIFKKSIKKFDGYNKIII